MKKYIKNCICFLLIYFSLFFMQKVEAKTLGELKSELSEAETKYNENQENKKQTESEISQTKERINSINKEKVELNSEISDLNEDLENLAEDIKNMETEIKSIVNYYQLSNTTSPYLDYIFQASDYTDFIYRLAVSEQLTKYREDKIDEYNSLVEENKNKLNELASKQTSLNSLEEELSVELSNLGSELSSISEASIDIKDEIDNLKSSVDLYQNKYSCSDNEQISTCVDRYNKKIEEEEAKKKAQQEATKAGSQAGGVSTATLPSADGFYRPVAAGRVNANYGYSSYYGSTFHYGMDIGVSHGTAVYAIADGTVVARWNKYSCGGNMVWIAHVINGKTYTSAYYHLASINVSVGDTVTKNTIIGYSGGSPSIETWDKCSTGAHLHLQMATGLYMTDYFWYSNFQSRSIDPRSVINFPSAGSSFTGR